MSTGSEEENTLKTLSSRVSPTQRKATTPPTPTSNDKIEALTIESDKEFSRRFSDSHDPAVFPKSLLDGYHMYVFVHAFRLSFF